MSDIVKLKYLEQILSSKSYSPPEWEIKTGWEQQDPGYFITSKEGNIVAIFEEVPNFSDLILMSSPDYFIERIKWLEGEKFAHLDIINRLKEKISRLEEKLKDYQIGERHE